jgi:NAD(P)-dependent dehydrogenase (short-subunit alcohol dehydrogenase family)
MMGKLDGKVAVVTGGSSGIGFATARAFHQEGAQVVITGRDQEALSQAQRTLGDGVVAMVADVTHSKDLEHLFTTTAARFGGVDVVFVNAGIARLGPIGTMTEAIVDEVMNINFKGAYFTIQHALPVLNPQASIILNGSVNAHVGFPNTSIYSASKAAVHSLARTLAAELTERGIRVNTLNIGPIDTPLYGKLGLTPEAIQSFADAIGSRLPLRRFGTADEVARAAVFLASNDSTFVVGSELTTDGGLVINSL